MESLDGQDMNAVLVQTFQTISWEVLTSNQMLKDIARVSNVLVIYRYKEY